MHDKRLLVVLVSLVLLSTTQVTDSLSQSATVYNGGHIFMCPAGDGPSLATQGAIIEVDFGTSGSGIPALHLSWDDNGSGDLSMCHTEADTQTDNNGVTQFSGVPFGGGWTQGNINVFHNNVATDFPGQQNVNSPDISGNGVVNLEDVGDFASDYFAWGLFQIYNFRSDFIKNGKIDLADVSEMSVHFGHTCP